jgi:site-specific recombinase XerD
LGTGNWGLGTGNWELGTEALRVRHYSLKTEKQYVYWVKEYVHFNNLKHPKDFGGSEIAHFLTHLAMDKNVAASTQNQALSALVFLYKNVLEIDLTDFSSKIRWAKKPKHLPEVFTKEAILLLELICQNRS